MQLTVLEMFNRLMRKTGQEVVTAANLTGLSGLQQLSWVKLQEAVDDFWGEALWEFAEAESSFTLASGSARYAMPGDLRQVDVESFVNRKADSKMHYVTPQKFISAHKDWREATAGEPGTVFPYKRKFQVHPKPKSANAGSAVDFFYWTMATTLGSQTASVAATISRMYRSCQDAIIELAAYKVNTYRGNPEALANYNTYYGFVESGGEKRPGMLDRCKDNYVSDNLDPDVTYQF